jgi:hypothetical protein
MKAHMLAPRDMPPARTLALLLVYHGMNGNEDNYYGGTVECLRRLKCENEFVVIAGKSKGGDDHPPVTVLSDTLGPETVTVKPGLYHCLKVGRKSGIGSTQDRGDSTVRTENWDRRTLYLCTAPTHVPDEGT